MPESRELVGLPGSGAVADIRRFRTVVRVASAASDDAACVLEHALPPGCVAMPVHRHARWTEVLHVLAGTLRVELGDHSHAVPAGASVTIPPGAWHTVWTDLDEQAPVRFLAMCAPGGMDRYYADVAALIPPAGTGAPDVQAVMAAGERYGVEVDMMSLYDLIERSGVGLA